MCVARVCGFSANLMLVPRVTLIFPPLRVSRDFIDYPYLADLGVMQAAAVLRSAGHEVTVIDAFALPSSTLQPLDDGYVLMGASVDDVIERVKNAPESDVVCVAYTPFHRPASVDAVLTSLLDGLKKQLASDVAIWLTELYQSGQHYVEANTEDILRAYPQVRGVQRYEAEDVLLKLVDDRSLSGELRGTDVASLDALPRPAWDLINLDHYQAFHERVVGLLGRGPWAFPLRGPTLPVVTSRGCPFRCAHCSSNPGREPGSVKTQRRYSSQYLETLFDEYVRLGIKQVHILDEMLNVNERHFETVLDLLNARGLKYEIPNGLRADYLFRSHLEKMKGHVTTLSISAESGSQRVADNVVGKQLDLSNIERVASECQQVGIPLLTHFFVGSPGETAADVNQTMAFALKLHDEYDVWPSMQFATPLPGTRLAEQAKQQGVRTLPVVDDYGPLFQKRPSIETDALTFEQLRRFRWTFEKRLEAAQGPKKVIMNVTYRCNNRCTFCATGTRTQLDGNPEQQAAQLLKYRKAGVKLLDFDGGEPTLNPNLFNLIKLARKMGYDKVNVTTNGRMCSYPDYAQKLVTSGVTSILFSIHGPDAQTHAQNVGVAEAFDQTIAGAKNVVALNSPTVALGANVTITKSNWKKLPALAQLVHDIGLKWLNLQFLTPFGRATQSVCPDTQAAADIVMKLIDDWKHLMKLQVINLPFCFMPGYEAYMMGDLLKLERHMIFVNTEEVNLFEYLRERRVKKPVCDSCTFASFCGGFYELDDVPEPPWLVHEEDLHQPVPEEIPSIKKHRMLPVVG